MCVLCQVAVGDQVGYLVCLFVLNSAFQTFQSNGILFSFFESKCHPEPSCLNQANVVLGPKASHPPSPSSRCLRTPGQEPWVEQMPWCFLHWWTIWAAQVLVCGALVTRHRRTGVERSKVEPALSPGLKSLGGSHT